MTPQEIQNIKLRYGIIGNSPLLNRAIEQAAQVAKTQLSVLITGENGVGKDVFSKILHDFSPRKHNKYFSVNCGAIAEGVINSELFGHAKGAFTDAKSDHAGYFEEANGGTLFLDEIAEMPKSTQALLLRVLENGEYRRVGESTDRHTKVRVVAATNKNLPQAILEDKFRQDLYYRLNGVEIHVPPLRDRKEDIPLLFRKFVADFAEQNMVPRVRLTPDAERMLTNYYWAGNIRQLRNVAESVGLMEAGHDVDAQVLQQYLPDNELNRTPVFIGHRSSDNVTGMSNEEREALYRVIDVMRQDLNDLHKQVDMLKTGHHEEPHTTAISHNIDPSTTHIQTPVNHINREEYEVAEEYHEEENNTSLEDVEKITIKQALERNRNSRKQTARELGISERTLYRKIKEYGL